MNQLSKVRWISRDNYLNNYEVYSPWGRRYVQMLQALRSLPGPIGSAIKTPYYGVVKVHFRLFIRHQFNSEIWEKFAIKRTTAALWRANISSLCNRNYFASDMHTINHLYLLPFVTEFMRNSWEIFNLSQANIYYKYDQQSVTFGKEVLGQYSAKFL